MLIVIVTRNRYVLLILEIRIIRFRSASLARRGFRAEFPTFLLTLSKWLVAERGKGRGMEGKR